jgi:Bacterial Ig-like domain (group 2)
VYDTAGNILTGRQVTWSSTNSGLVGVSVSGLVSGLAIGSATVTASSGGKSGTVSVVSQLTPVFRITVAPPTLSLNLGLTVQLTATAYDSSGNVLSGRVAVWSIDSPSLASVSVGGIVSAIAIGTVNVTATIGGKSAVSTITLLPPIAPLDSLFACAADTVLASVSKTIGLLGGTINFGHHSLVIPPAALLVSTNITATQLADAHLSVDLEPAGLQFLVPPTLIMGYGQCSPLPPSNLQIAYLNGPLGQILDLLLSTNNTSAHTLSALITHFSVYAGAESIQ